MTAGARARGAGVGACVGAGAAGAAGASAAQGLRGVIFDHFRVCGSARGAKGQCAEGGKATEAQKRNLSGMVIIF